MKRLAIVEYIMSAGGVERVLRGLSEAFLSISEARDWDITLLLSRYNSAHHRCEWPAELTGPNLHVEWFGEHSAVGRTLDPLAHAQGVRGLPFSKTAGLLAARGARRIGPSWWRAYLGDPGALISQASGRFDVMYFTYPFWIDAPKMASSVVTTPQDFNFKHFLKEGTWNRRQQETATKGWLERSDRVLLSSRAVEGELLQFYPEYASKAQVVHLGLSVGSTPPSPDEVERFRRTHGLPSEFLLITGWVVPHKNQLTVVEAAGQLRRRGSSIPLVFVGPNAAHLGESPAPGFRGEYAEAVKGKLRAEGFVLGKDFHALGYVTDLEVQCLYRLATAFVMPSLYEGFGLPTLEAMLAGCPVVMSAIPPLLEQNELLGGIIRTFDPKDPRALADQIAWVLEHRVEAAEVARLAAERVPQVYDWKKTARAYLKAFDEVIEERRRAGAPAPRPPSAGLSPAS